jgi:hypothetical protein
VNNEILISFIRFFPESPTPMYLPAPKNKKFSGLWYVKRCTHYTELKIKKQYTEGVKHLFSKHKNRVLQIRTVYVNEKNDQR